MVIILLEWLNGLTIKCNIKGVIRENGIGTYPNDEKLMFRIGDQEWSRKFSAQQQHFEKIQALTSSQ